MTTIIDRTVLVTGANRGLGREFVAQFLARGAAKVYAASRNPETVDVSDPRVVALRIDVADAASVSAASGHVHDVDVVVNNAGISLATSVLSADTADLRRELEVNLLGSLTVTSAFVDGVIERGGAIVNVGSVLSWIGLGGSYGVSTAALWSATDSMRLELAPRGVQVLGLYMGYVDTDMTAGVTDPGIAPAEVVRQALDGLEAGADEVLADRTAGNVRARLNLPFDQRYAPYLAAGATR
jgi:NAD(P)-dependent dehydrogenase (short-subunit alcohol dehydrogenase family)